jgi:uncharacterized repeat protein (TIGR02543 family)
MTIRNTGAITFESCAKPGSNYGGGAIYTGAFTVTNSGAVRFVDCTTGGYGGAVACCGNTIIENATFNDCVASGNGGAIYVGGSYVYDSTVTTITGCEIDGHVGLPSETPNSGASANYGGGGIYVDNGDASMTGTTIKNCTSAKKGGAAFFNMGAYDRLTVDGCEIDGHDSLASSVANATDGGGLALNVNDHIAIENTRILDCTASGSGGGIHTVSNAILQNGVQISGCGTTATSGKGAALFLATSGKSVHVNGGTVAGANGVKVTGCSAAAPQGGALECVDGAKFYFEGNAYIHDNPTSASGQRNVVLAYDNRSTINTTTNGLGEDAAIGVYVTDAYLSKRGEKYTDFGTFATNTDNLDAFMNDRRALVGGEKDKDTIAWSSAYNLLLDPNGGEGTTISVMLTYFKEYTLGAPFTKDGYHFAGWNTRKDGTGDSYAASDVVSELTDEDGGTVTLYAQWEDYTACGIYFHPNGGTEVPSREVKPGTTLGLLPSSTREHYTFVRWMLMKDGVEESYSQNTVVNEDMHFYALWEKKVAITFDAQGGIVGESVREMAPGKIGTLPKTEQPAAAKHDYEFVRWYALDQDGNRSTVTANTEFTKDDTVYAEWKVIPRRLRYNTNGGYPGRNYATNDYWYDSEELTDLERIKNYTVQNLPSVTNRGYELDGWFVGSTRISNGDAPIEGVTIDLRTQNVATAHWTKLDWVTVSFNSDGGSACNAISVYKGDKVDHYPEPTKKGYAFKGWYLLDEANLFAKDAEGNDIEVNVLTPINEDITVKAKWESYVTVTFDSDGGSTCSPISVEKGTRIKDFPKPTKDGYVFAGWFTDAGVEVDESTVISEDMTVKAKWNELVTVTFNWTDRTDASGSPVVTTETVEKGKSLLKIPGTYREGYVLEGWYPDEQFAGEPLTASTVISEDTTYYAKWRLSAVTKESPVEYEYNIIWTDASTSELTNLDDCLSWYVSGSPSRTIEAHAYVGFALKETEGKVFPEGSVKVRVPKYVFEDWNGRRITGTNNIVEFIPKAPAKSKSLEWNYVDEGDYYLLQNTRASENVTLDLKITYAADLRDVKAARIDSETGKHLDAHGNVLEHDDYAPRANTFTVMIQSDGGTVEESKVLSTAAYKTYTQTTYTADFTKGSASARRTWNDAWGEKPADADDYYYVTWVHGGFTVRAHGDFAGSTAGLFETTSKEWVDDAYDVVYTDPAGNYVVTRHPYAELTGSRKTLYKKEVARGSWTASGVEETGRGTIPCEIDYRVYEPYTPTPTSESVTGLGASKSFGYWYYKGFRTGQDALLDDETLSTSAYTLSMSGPGADHLVQKGDTNLYYADEYTMVMRDGAPGDISCYSERSGRRVRLGDNDYDFTRLSISLSNSDGYRDDSGWHSLANTAYSSWRPVEVWLRKTGETEFYKYTDVYITSGSSKAVVLPSDTAGFEVRHSTFYWRTHLSVSPTIVINPTTHVKNVVQPDYLARVATRFYNKASYQAVSNDTGEVRWSGTREDDFYIGKSKTGLRVSKSVDSSKVVLDNENSVQTVPVTVTGYHYNDSGRVKPIHSGVFYELLPLDTIVDESSVYVEAGSTRLSRGMVNVEYAADWQGSGQTMMIVSVGMPETIRSSSVELHYTLTNTYENIIARGTNLYTPSAFANTSTVKEYYEVLPKVKRINEIKDGQKYFSEQEKAYGEYVAYGSADVKFRDINVSSSSFSKAVNTLNAYAEDAEVIAQTPYTYRLVYGQSDYAKSDSVVLYDLLDQGSVSDEYSNLYGVASAWQGTFGDVRVPEVTSDGQKCKPVVYYSTTDEKDINNLSKDLTDTAVWSTTRPSERITAIAIDFSKDEHGNDFVLTGKDSIVAYVTMTSPADETLNGKTAVNTAISTSRISAVGAAVEERHLEAQTTVMMKPVVPTITLTSTPASGTKDSPRLMAYKDTLTYDIAIHNPDTEFAYRNISLEDLLPEGVTPERGNIYVYTESDPSTRVKIGGSTRVSQSLEGDLSKRLAFEVGELLPGETLHIAIPCVVDTKEGRLENQATLTEVNGLVKELKSEKTYHEVRQYDVLYGKKKLGVDPEEFLAGASLQLLDASGNKVDGWKSTDASGTERHTVRIGAGEYTLEETEAPKDYAIADPIRFTLSREGLVTLRGETDPLEDRVVDMYDKYIAVDVVVENHTLGDDADPQKEFAYTATMTGLKPGETYAAGSQSFTADRAGNATYEFKLKGDENMTLSKLPTGASVVVTQVGTDYSTSYVAKATKDGAETVLHSGETNLKGQDLVTQSTDVDVDQGVVHFSFQNVLNQNVTPVRFVVYDETGETPLAGSSFKLLGPEPAEGETQYVYEWVSKEDHKRVDVPQGHEYALTQTSAADGYLPMEGDFALVVDEDGTVTSKGEGAELTQDENGYVVVIRNVRQAHVKVQNKSTATDYFLAGAELELLEGTDLETAQRVGEPWKSEAEAARDLYLKADKTYFIRKTSSPANHLAVDPVVVKVTVDTQRKVVVEPASNYDDKTETVTLYDRPVETLAITSKVTGADPDKPFEYTISDLKEGETYSYAITDNAGKTTEGTMTVDADGKAHFGLRHDETIVIRDLPHSITISETKPEGHYYNTEWIQDETNVLKPEDTIASSTVPVSLNGRNSIVVTNKECVARVRNKTTDGAWSDWTYFEYLTSDAGDGAFDFANGLTGDVEIETLWESHDRYEMSQGFEFTNQGITSLTIQSTETLTKAGKHTTITGNSASSLLVFNTEGPVEVKNLEFDGKEHAQTSDGGAMSVGSGSLVLTDVEIHDFTTLGNGGAVYVGNDATLTMEDGTAIKDCSATHGGAVYAAHENGQKGSFVMNGGTITGNTTTQDGHAAVEAATMQFNGTVKVIGNTNRISDSAANVLLDVNSNEVIRSLRLEEDSEIGVYVNDEQLEAHGGSGDPFGTYTVDQNLDKFTNDRKPDLYAEAADDPSSKRIIWHATESNLTIAHTVSGDYADLTRKFEITVTSEQLAGQTVQLEGSDMPLTFDENGVAIISLANGESVTLFGLPDATVVSVVSEGTPYKTSYTVTQGDVTSDDPTHITMKSGMDARVDIASVLDVVPATGIGEDAAAWGSLVAISAVCFFFLWEHRRRRA